MNNFRLLSNFNFEISLLKATSENSDDVASGSILAESNSAVSDDILGNGGFQECSGLEIDMDVKEYLEGGRNDGLIQQIGRAKYAPIVLKRGMFYGKENRVSSDLWTWLQGIVAGQRPVVRYNGMVTVFDRLNNESARTTLATWVFDRALPTRLRGPTLNAKSGDVAIEELHLVHEGLRLKVN